MRGQGDSTGKVAGRCCQPANSAREQKTLPHSSTTTSLIPTHCHLHGHHALVVVVFTDEEFWPKAKDVRSIILNFDSYQSFPLSFTMNKKESVSINAQKSGHYLFIFSTSIHTRGEWRAVPEWR